MSGSSAFPLPSSRTHFAMLPGKIAVKSDDALPFCTLFIISQIFWYSVGLSVIYDVAERLWHWPHLMVAGVYGGMLVASAWLSRRMVKICSALTVLLLLCIGYYSCAGQDCQLGFMQGLVNVMASRYIDYTSWLFVMGSSILGCLSLVWMVNDKQINLALWMALLSFLVGCSIAILPQASAMYATGANMESIFATQGMNLIWLAYWGVPMRCSQKGHEGFFNKLLAKYLPLPKRTIILTMGALSYIFYDWACQYLATWLQIIWFFAPVVLYFYLQKKQMTPA